MCVYGVVWWEGGCGLDDIVCVCMVWCGGRVGVDLMT